MVGAGRKLALPCTLPIASAQTCKLCSAKQQLRAELGEEPRNSVFAEAWEGMATLTAVLRAVRAAGLAPKQNPNRRFHNFLELPPSIPVGQGGT